MSGNLGIKFEKVSYEAYRKDVMDAYGDQCFTERDIKRSYAKIKLPERSDPGSAGYDFFLQWHLSLYDGDTMKIVTGVKAKMPEGIVLIILPRSGLGTKEGIVLANTAGVIDSSYYNNETNEGDIILVLRKSDRLRGFYDGRRETKLKCDSRVAQGIFLPYFTTDDDETQGTRTGGFGSSGN